MIRSTRADGIAGSLPMLSATAVAMLLLLFVPLAHNGYYENLGRGLLMYAAMALGWNVIGGYAGYVSFGNVVFFGLGAYTSGVLAAHGMLNVFVAIPIAAVVGAIFAFLFGVPILRLRGHYFAIATLAVALATQEVIANIDGLGGGSGLTLHQSTVFVQYYYAMWVVCALSIVGTLLIARSKLGYALVAIRENEDAAAALGVDPVRFKVLAWVLSATMTAAAGAVFAFANGFIDPPTVFGVDYSVFPIVMALLGGVSTVAGPVIGAFILTALNEVLWSHFPQLHTLFFGAAIVIVVLFLPRGLLYLIRQRGGWRAFTSSFQAYRV